MKKPALILLGCLLVILAADLVLLRSAFWYWTPISRDTNLKLFALAADQTQYDVIFLGSSSADFSFHPGVIEEELSRLLPRPEPWRVYNAGMRGAFIPTFVDEVRRIVGTRQQPKLLVQMLETREFNGFGRTLHQQIRFFTVYPEDYWLVLRHATRPDQRWAALRGLFHGLEVFYQLPAYPFFRDEVRSYQEQHGRINYRDYPVLTEAMTYDPNLKRLPPPMLERAKKSRAREYRFDIINSFEITPLIEGWFRQLAAEVKAAGAPMVVLMAPESDWLIQKTFLNHERELAADYLARECAKEGFAFYDMKTEPFKPDDSEFVDGTDHLGFDGSVRLSRTVAREILAPALAAAPSGP